MVDVLALRSDEGRSRLRKATGSCQQTLIRGYPNGATHHVGDMVFLPEHIG